MAEDFEPTGDATVDRVLHELQRRFSFEPSQETVEGPDYQQPSAEDVAKELDRIFDYHAPDKKIQAVHETWRSMVKQLAGALMSLPVSRERSMAVTRLEEVSFWIHATIARNHGKFSTDG